MVRQFIVRSLGALLVLSLVLLTATRASRLMLGALAGGGWMIVNCVVIVWMGGKALQHRDARRSLCLFGFIAAVLTALAAGGWLAFALQSAWVGMALGLTIPLAVFLFQLQRLKRSLGSDAR
ncbi:MAG: hypothetical protein A3B78_01090 [Omnitrophica WOR_2 bacterium RIFCSPHIGHO2_02_FULL_67_20]|nr:MAG: hypothetical protein A3B78_01090 [Omnitrophica WOR_2 bacterium RIFCSPHIGHO2_02_FULL_67_20]